MRAGARPRVPASAPGLPTVTKPGTARRCAYACRGLRVVGCPRFGSRPRRWKCITTSSAHTAVTKHVGAFLSGLADDTCGVLRPTYARGEININSARVPCGMQRRHRSVLQGTTAPVHSLLARNHSHIQLTVGVHCDVTLHIIVAEVG